MHQKALKALFHTPLDIYKIKVGFVERKDGSGLLTRGQHHK